MSWWVLTFVVPLAGAVVLTATRQGHRGASVWLRRATLRTAWLAPLPALVLALLGAATADRVSVPWLLFGTTLQLDAVGRPLLLVGALLYAAALASVGERTDARAAELASYLLVSFVGNIGVYLAADAVTFYLCFAVMSFSAAGLVIHERNADARRATRIYLVLTVISESAILMALMLVAHAGGIHLADAPAAVARSPYALLIVALLIIGFGVKAGLVPLHVWLPLAHPAAPPAASAVLSGAMVKAGLVGWFRFLPLGEREMDVMGMLLVALALLGAFALVPLGVMQSDPKVVLAYSTVSQLGFLGVVVGVALASPALAPACVAAGTIYAVHHGLAKGALFLGVPTWKIYGSDTRRRLVMAGLLIAALAVAGAPLSTGALGKYASKEAVEGVAVLGVDLVHLLPLVATGSTVLLARFGWLLLRSRAEPRPVGVTIGFVAWWCLVLTSVTVPWIIADPWVPLDAVPGLEPVTLWAATWPIILGLVMAWIGWWVARWPSAPAWVGRITGRTLPAGDIVVLEERLIRRVAPPLTGHVRAGRRRVQDAATRLDRMTRRVGRAAPRLDAVEGGLDRWATSGVLLLTMAVLIVAVAGVTR